MRYGVTDALRQYLEGVPTKARPILETLTTAATDIRDHYSDWLTADSLTGLTPTVEWVQLQGSGLTTILENTTQNAGADITALTAPLSSPLNVALIEWSEATTAPEDEILGATAYLDPRRDGGSPVEVARFYAAIFQLVNITDEGGEQVWNLRQLAADIVDADENGAAGNVSFSFGLNGRGPVVGPRAPIIERGTVIDYYAKPATVLMVWAIKADGSDAGNVAWRCDANASQVTSNGHVISRRTLTVLDDEFATAPLQYTISTAQSGVPVCSITNNGTFSDATIQWTGDGNDFDLGQTPGADTDLQLTLQYATPNDSEVRGYLYDNNSAAWVRFYDGDVIGQDNSADPAVVSGDIYANNGADLSGVSRLQAYDVKVELDASTGGRHTPRLFRVGLIEVEREALDGLVEFGETAYAIDPVTSQSEISQLKLFLSRDGVRDYRSWAEELFASSALNKTEFRIWVGHPDLARQDWLHIDDYIVAGYSPSATGIAVDCVSSLQYALATIPPESGNARSPIVFDGTTLQATYNSVLNTHVGLATRYRGVGIQDNTTTVAKTIDKSIEAIDVLRELTFLDGSALISSQGRFKVQRIVDATDPTFIEAPLVAFERDEVEVTAVTAGFERRITQFGVPYGWADGEYAGERETSAPTTVLDNFGLRGTLGKQMLDDSIAQWIDTAALADRIGDRMIALFATGCIQMRIRTAVPHPHLEPGDPIALDQDVFVGYDPLNARSLRGRAGMRGRVVQCHDIMGTDFTLWLLPAVSSGKTQITVVNTLKGLGVASSDVPSGAVTQYEGDINHNALLNYDANRHIDHTAVSISTDSGLDGGGDLTASRTISLAFNELSDRTFAGTDKLVFYSPDGGGHFTDIASGIPISVFQNTSLIDTISAGTGIAVAITSGTERTISIDYDASNLITDATEISPTTVADGDWILVADTSDSLNLRKAQVSNWPYKGTVTSVSGGAGLTATGSDAVTLNVGAGDGISVGLDTVSLNIDGLTDVSTETAPDNKMLGTDQLVFSRGSALFKDTANTIPLSAFNDDLGYKNNQAGAGITITSGQTYNTISVNGASGGSGFFQTAWDNTTTPISTDAMVFGDGGLTGTASTVLFSDVPVSIFQDNGYYALDSDLTSHTGNTSNPHSVTKAQVGLGNVENTALSGWAGSTAITTLGTISTGTVPAANVGAGQFGGAFTIQGAFAPSANNTYALGASGYAWAKVWTYDLDVANNTVFGGNLTVGNTSGDLFIPNGQVLADGGGTVSAPSYSFDNDLNTGIYPAGADTLGFATGGVERVTIASNGNLAVDTSTLFVDAVNNRVGIGTAIPSTVLDVQSGSANPAKIITSSVTNSSLLIGNTSTGSAVLTLDGANGDGAGADYFTIQQNNDLTANIYTQANAGVLTLGSKGTSNAITIDGANVGIGVTPSYRLHVVGGATIANRTTSDTAGDVSLGVLSTASVAQFGWRTDTSNNLHFDIYNGASWSSALTTSLAGNLGLGTTPSAWSGGYRALQFTGGVLASTVNDLALGFNYYYDGGNKHINTGPASLYYQAGGEHYWYNAASGSAGAAITFVESMRIDSSGRVGIGTVPAATLHLVDTSGPTIRMQRGSNRFWVGAGYDDLSFVSGDSSTAVAVFDGFAGVGIGTASPAGRIDTNDSVNGFAYTSFRNSSTGASAAARLRVGNNGSPNAFTIDVYGFSHGTKPNQVDIWNQFNAPLTLGSNGTERVRIEANGVTRTIAGVTRTNTRVSSSAHAPLGHYTPGDTVWEFDPTWSNDELRSVFNHPGVSWYNDSTAPGGYCIYIGQPLYVGGVYGSGVPFIPVADDEYVYMECWLRQESGTSAIHYMGSIDYNHNLSSLGGNPGSFGYWVMYGASGNTTWTKYSGVITGFGTSVGQFATYTKYWTPMALFNYSGSSSRSCYISGWKAIRCRVGGPRYFGGDVVATV